MTHKQRDNHILTLSWSQVQLAYDLQPTTGPIRHAVG